MPVAPQVSYPGVYIQEVESPVHTIAPVPTATTAFIGRALRGPVNEPRLIHSFGDFQRIFGGLWTESQLGYAVNDFFLNGGSDAVIVRLFNPDPDTATASLSVPSPHPAAQEVFNAVAEAVALLPKPTAGDLKNAAKRAYDKIHGDATTADKAAKSVKDQVEGASSAEEALGAAQKAAVSETHPAAQEVFNAVKEKYDAVKALTDESRLIELKNAAKRAYDKIQGDATTADTAAKSVKDKVDQVAGNDDKAELNNEQIKAVLKAAQTALVSDGVQLRFEAKYPGAWGKNLCVRITDVDQKVVTQLAQQYGVTEGDLFNVTVHDKGTGATETFLNVTAVAGPRQLDQVLKNESELVRVVGELARPVAHLVTEAKNWWEVSGACSVADGEATDGEPLTSTEFEGKEAEKTGIYALEKADIFNLLVIPPYTSTNDVDTTVLSNALAYCVKRRAILIIDPPSGWKKKEDARQGFPIQGLAPSENAVVYFPRVLKANPLRQNQVEEFAPGGIVAGVMARTDRQRGVWKAPAGLEATLAGVNALSIPLTDAENGELNPLGINCLRQMPAAGYVVWGARTTLGDDRLASQWKYIPVRRTALYIEESLYRGTQWAVFEPNDEPLWSQLRLNIGVFMHGLFRQGAFQGQSPKDAYFVKCDSSTTTQADIDRGIVNIVVGFAPLKPAEFVVLYIQQMAGQLAT